jgi:hypothetical protein
VKSVGPSALDQKVEVGSTFTLDHVQFTGGGVVKQYLIVPIFLLGLSGGASADERLVQDWRDLWTRCRVAIENVQPLDTTGLTDLGFSIQHQPALHPEGWPEPIMPAYDYPEHKWRLAGSRFFVREREWPPIDGKVRRGCDIHIAEDAAQITSAEETLLADAFRAERDRLLATGEYEMQDPTPPIASTALGLRPLKPNANECRVISPLFVDTRPDMKPFFTSGTGEQAIHGICGGKPMLR